VLILSSRQTTLFQITISRDHGINLEKLAEILKRMPEGYKGWLYFVVPADIFKNYKRQKYFTKQNEEVARITKAALDQRIEQWVLEIPMSYTREQIQWNGGGMKSERWEVVKEQQFDKEKRAEAVQSKRVIPTEREAQQHYSLRNWERRER